MNYFHVKASSLSGKIKIPSSKSHTHRAILFAALAKGTSTIRNFLDSPDTQTMMQACALLGASIKKQGEDLEITGIAGQVGKAQDVIQAGNSGIVLRFISAIAALSAYPIVITGDHSIRFQRPMKPLLGALRQLGASAISTKNDDLAPIIVQGPLKGGLARLDGADSQPVSALLIAGSLCEQPVEIIVDNPGEKPWITFTQKWLEFLGVSIVNEDFKHFYLKGGASFQAFDYRVPGDFSTAAFPIAAALVTQSEILLENLDMNDFQGDKKLIAILQKMGACITPSKEGLLIEPSCLQGIEIDVNDVIDAVPVLAILGCFAKGKTVLKNGHIARTKECDRLHCLAKELSKMGAKIEELDDGLIIEQAKLNGTQVDGHADHRLSMALTIAGLGSKGETLVTSVESIKKTFPSFVQDFQLLQADIQ